MVDMLGTKSNLGSHDTCFLCCPVVVGVRLSLGDTSFFCLFCFVSKFIITRTWHSTESLFIRALETEVWFLRTSDRTWPRWQVRSLFVRLGGEVACAGLPGNSSIEYRGHSMPRGLVQRSARLWVATTTLQTLCVASVFQVPARVGELRRHASNSGGVGQR